MSFWKSVIVIFVKKRLKCPMQKCKRPSPLRLLYMLYELWYSQHLALMSSTLIVISYFESLFADPYVSRNFQAPPYFKIKTSVNFEKRICYIEA